MTDVARLAGVSVSTVSYALSGSRPVSPATRERIDAAMAELNYTPNLLARGLRGRHSKIIALLFPTRGRGVDLTGLDYVVGAADHAHTRDYHLLLWSAEADSLGALRTLAGQGLVDGALLMEVTMNDPRIDVLHEANIPFAMVGRNQDPSNLNWVDTDFEQCAHLALEHLAELNHRHVALVNQDPARVRAGLGSAIRVRDGAIASARALGMTLEVFDCDTSATAGARLFDDLSRRHPEITAVIGNNEQALPGIMSAVMARRQRIPDAFSLVAIALSERSALMSAPAMTTVAATAANMGRDGVDLLINRLMGGEQPVVQRLFPGELHLRGTTGPARTQRF